MILAKCLFEPICKHEGFNLDRCPFNRPDMWQTVNILQIKCSTWNAFRETNKERRLRYAQEKRLRDEIKGSGGKA